jgi:Flp pilus assembly protein CpaB
VNPRQRRGVLLILLSLVGAAAVFILVVNYVSEVNRQVGPITQVLALNADVSAFQPITPEMVVPRDVPVQWAPPRALQSAVEVGGRISTVPLAAGTILQEGMLTIPPEISAGQREIAILVDAETGVAGRITSGSVVDIFATFPGGEGIPAQAAIVIEQAEIINVGVPATTNTANAQGGFQQGAVVPITFALSVQESQQLVYVEEFASSLRLALRSPVDEQQLDLDARIYQPNRDSGNLDDLLAPPGPEDGAPTAPALPGAGQAPANGTDDGDDAGGGVVPPPVPGGGR